MNKSYLVIEMNGHVMIKNINSSIQWFWRFHSLLKDSPILFRPSPFLFLLSFDFLIIKAHVSRHMTDVLLISCIQTYSSGQLLLSSRFSRMNSAHSSDPDFIINIMTRCQETNLPATASHCENFLRHWTPPS